MVPFHFTQLKSAIITCVSHIYDWPRPTSSLLICLPIRSFSTLDAASAISDVYIPLLTQLRFPWAELVTTVSQSVHLIGKVRHWKLKPVPKFICTSNNGGKYSPSKTFGICSHFGFGKCNVPFKTKDHSKKDHFKGFKSLSIITRQ